MSATPPTASENSPLSAALAAEHMAVLGDVVGRLAAMQLKIIRNKFTPGYSIKRTINTMRRPLFAGENELLHSGYLDGHRGDYTFYTSAMNREGAEFAATAFTLMVCHADDLEKKRKYTTSLRGPGKNDRHCIFYSVRLTNICM